MLTASQIKSLKQSINTEMSRRMASGSQSDVTLTNPAFNTSPEDKTKIKAEHGTKTLGVLAQMSSIGSIPRFGGQMEGDKPIPSEFDYNKMQTFISNLASKSATASSGEANTGCSASCSGLCAGTCYSSCQGNFSDNFSGNFDYSFGYSFSSDFSGSSFHGSFYDFAFDIFNNVGFGLDFDNGSGFTTNGMFDLGCSSNFSGSTRN